jgi:hypothetical protein
MLSDIFRPFFHCSWARAGAEEPAWAWRLRVKRPTYTMAPLPHRSAGGGLQVTITLPLRISTRQEDLQLVMNEA